MPEPVTIIGSFLSPYVRKVLAVLHLKGIDYRVDPIVAFMGDDRFTELSPLRRIPVLIDDRVTLCDSSVICQYLEDRYPTPAVYPADIVERARARWLEEYADTRMGDVFIWQLFNQVAIGPHVFGRPTDEAALRRAIEVEVPQVLAHLEPQVPAEGFLFGGLSIADISLCVFLRNAEFARQNLDPVRWPRIAAYAQRVLAHDCLARLRPYEQCMMKTPIARHREALGAIGAPLTRETWGTTQARPGIMRI